MLLKSIILAVVGTIIFFISLAISYELPDFPKIVLYILWIIGFILIIIAAILGNKSIQKK